MGDEGAEIAYYRTIEDQFATLRGVPHTLSPKDFQLIRSWWREQVPLAAVTAGLTEVFARRRERGDQDTIVSLSYCRHAVKAQARRLAEARVGQPEETGRTPDQRTDALHELVSVLSRRAQALAHTPALAEVLQRGANLVAAAAELDDSVLDEHLFSLESVLLEACWNALGDALRHDVEEVAAAAATAATTDEGRARAARAARDREIRRRLGLPRLELP